MPRFVSETIYFLKVNQSYGIVVSKSFLPRRIRWFFFVECSPSYVLRRETCIYKFRLCAVFVKVVLVGICARVFSTEDLAHWVGVEIRD